MILRHKKLLNLVGINLYQCKKGPKNTKFNRYKFIPMIDIKAKKILKLVGLYLTYVNKALKIHLIYIFTYLHQMNSFGD